MSVASYYRRPASSVGPDETLREAAQRMEKAGTGFLVVTEEERLAGVLTDRDVALHVAAGGHDAGVARVADAMTPRAVAIDVAAPVEEVLSVLAGGRVRRLPVVDGDQVEGVVSADDLMLLLAGEIAGLGEVLRAQLPGGSPRARKRAALPGHVPRAAEHYRREVVTARAGARVAELAREMERRAVGSVLVLDDDGAAVGLVTDRDIALRVVAAGLDPATAEASTIMSTPLVVAQPTDPLEEVVTRMRTAGVRRVPILAEGRPVGIVSFDDLLVAFGHELAQLAECVSQEIRSARARFYPARMRQELEDRIEDAVARLRDAGDQTLRGLARELDQVIERVGNALGVGRAPARPAPLAVADLMRSEVRTCTPEDALSEPARIMWEHDCGCVPVVAADGSGRVVGMLTDRDVCMALYTSGGRLAELQVKSAMARQVRTCRPEDPLAEAEATLRTAQVRRLPVVDAKGHLRGVLSLADIAEAAAGVRAPAGAVSAEEVGLLLAAVCRPRSALAV